MNTNFFQKIWSWIKNHKGWSTTIVIVIIGVGYYFYHKANTANATPQYVLSAARFGTLRQTVTGTGQISASNQTDILSQGSGTILSVDVNVGQSVTAGQLIATIDSKNAAISLENAKLSLAKLTEPAKATDLSNTTNTVNKSYNDAFNTASTAYLDLPAIMSGMKDLLYSQTGFLSDQKSSYLNSTAQTYRQQAGIAYDAAVNQYSSSLTEFKGLSRTSSQSAIDQLLIDTYTTMKDVADSVTKVQNAISYITTTQSDYFASTAVTTAANVNGWASQANSDVSSIVAAQNNVATAKNSLTTLQTGTDPLDIQSARLSLAQAQTTYDNYFVRAPYDGVIGRIPVSVYGQAGASTVIATIVGQQKVASISLNEVDAAKVKAGQTVTITFNAIDGLNATGTVQQIDQVGTVTQGVVSYAVKILVNTADDRIKPGMSVNTTIVTNQENNVLLVPNSAVKTQGNASYVQTFDQTTLNSLLAKSGISASASTTRQFARSASSTGQSQFASTSNGYAGGRTNDGNFGGPGSLGSTTRTFGSSSRALSASSAQTRTTTISSATLPAQTIVTVGDSDDTNTVILSGLNPGQLVVTRTIASGSAQTTGAPSILSSLGGNRGGATGGAGGAARPTGATTARPGN